MRSLRLCCNSEILLLQVLCILVRLGDVRQSHNAIIFSHGRGFISAPCLANESMAEISWTFFPKDNTFIIMKPVTFNIQSCTDASLSVEIVDENSKVYCEGNTPSLLYSKKTISLKLSGASSNCVNASLEYAFPELNFNIQSHYMSAQMVPMEVSIRTIPVDSIKIVCGLQFPEEERSLVASNYHVSFNHAFVRAGKTRLSAVCRFLQDRRRIGSVSAQKDFFVEDDLQALDMPSRSTFVIDAATDTKIEIDHSYAFPITYHLFTDDRQSLVLSKQARYDDYHEEKRQNMTFNFEITTETSSKLGPGNHTCSLVIENHVSSHTVQLYFIILEKISEIVIQPIPYIDIFPTASHLTVSIPEGCPAFTEITLKSKQDDTTVATSNSTCNNLEECREVRLEISVRFEGVFTIFAKASNELGEVKSSWGFVESFPLVYDVYMTSISPIYATKESTLLVLYKIATSGEFIIELSIDGEVASSESIKVHGKWSKAKSKYEQASIPFNAEGYMLYTTSHTFEKPGEHEVISKVLSKNKKQSKSHEAKITVLEEDVAFCISGVQIRDGNSDNSLSASLDGSAGVTLSVNIQTKCAITDDTKIGYRWTIFETDSLEEKANFSREIHVEKMETNRNDLYLAKDTLLPGIYVVEVSADISLLDKKVQSFTDYSALNISERKLDAQICGGSMRELGVNQTKLQLDASCSYNPHTDGIKYQWFCSLTTEDLPSDKHEGKFRNKGSCFGWKPSYVGDGKTTELMMNRTNMEDKIYIRMFVSHPNFRNGHADQEVGLLLRPAPDIKIRCWANCRATLRPQEPLILKAFCESCVKYAWTTMLGSIDSCSSGEFCKLSSLLLSRTARQFDEDIVITVQGFDDMGQNSSATISSHVSTPPSNGKCSVRPSTGSAFVTKFNISCDFKVKNSYRFSLINEASTSSSLLQYGYESNLNDLMLPPGKSRIKIDVCDAEGACNEDVEISVTAKDDQLPKKDAFLALENTLKSGDRQKITQIMSVLPASAIPSDMRERVIKTALDSTLTSPESVKQVSDLLSHATRDQEVTLQSQNEIGKKLNGITSWLSRDTEASNTFKGSVAKSSLDISSNLISSLKESKISSKSPHLSVLNAIDQLSRESLQTAVPGEGTKRIVTSAFTTTVGKFIDEDIVVSDKDEKIEFQIPSDYAKETSINLQVHRFNSSNTNFSSQLYAVDEVISVSMSKSVFNPGDIRTKFEMLLLPNSIKYALRNRHQDDAGYRLVLRQDDIDLWSGKTEIAVSEGQHSMSLKIRITSDDISDGDNIHLSIRESNILDANIFEKEANVSGQDFNKDNGITWTIALGGHTIFNVDIKVQKPLFSGNVTVNVFPYAVRCMFWDDVASDWRDSGCKASLNSTMDDWTHCECNGMQSEGRSNLKKLINPKLFSSKIIVYPNKIDLDKVSWNLWEEFLENPVIISTVLGAYVFFGMLIMWASIRDNRQMNKPSFIEVVDNSPCNRYRYLLTIFTGSRYRAGSTSKIHLRLIGREETSPVYSLQESNENRALTRGSVVTFLVTTPNSVGDISALGISHNEAGKDPEWYIDRMVLRDLEKNMCWFFLARSWIPLKEAEKRVTDEVIISAASLKELHSFNSLFVIKCENYMKDRHIWYSLLAMRPWSCHDMTRVQRVGCCTLLIFMLMLTSLMFYGRVYGAAEGEDLDLGQKLLSNIVKGIESCLLVFPVTYMVAVLFRSSRDRHHTYFGRESRSAFAPFSIPEMTPIKQAPNSNELVDISECLPKEPTETGNPESLLPPPPPPPRPLIKLRHSRAAMKVGSEDEESAGHASISSKTKNPSVHRETQQQPQRKIRQKGEKKGAHDTTELAPSRGPEISRSVTTSRHLESRYDTSSKTKNASVDREPQQQRCKRKTTPKRYKKGAHDTTELAPSRGPDISRSATISRRLGVTYNKSNQPRKKVKWRTKSWRDKLACRRLIADDTTSSTTLSSSATCGKHYKFERKNRRHFKRPTLKCSTGRYQERFCPNLRVHVTPKLGLMTGKSRRRSNISPKRFTPKIIVPHVTASKDYSSYQRRRLAPCNTNFHERGIRTKADTQLDHPSPSKGSLVMQRVQQETSNASCSSLADQYVTTIANRRRKGMHEKTRERSYRPMKRQGKKRFSVPNSGRVASRFCVRPTPCPSARPTITAIEHNDEVLGGGVTVMDVDPGSVDYKPLPWFCVYVGWLLIVTVVVGSSVLSVMYGMTFGYDISKQWLIALLTGFLQSAFLLEPIKAVLLAYFVVINNPRLDLTDWIPPLRSRVDSKHTAQASGENTQ